MYRKGNYYKRPYPSKTRVWETFVFIYIKLLKDESLTKPKVPFIYYG